MIRPRWEFRHGGHMAGKYFGGGDSSSESTTQQSTTNQDNRIAVQGGANVGAGATVSGLTINDPTAQIAAMDLSKTSTLAALAANTAAIDDARAAMMAASKQAADASAAAAVASAQSAGAAASVANNAMAGTWGASANLQKTLIDGMNTVLSSANNVMDMEQAAFKQVGGQIQAAFQSASDVSSGNRQLVTVGMVVAGIVAFMAFKKGGLAA